MIWLNKLWDYGKRFFGIFGNKKSALVVQGRKKRPLKLRSLKRRVDGRKLSVSGLQQRRCFDNERGETDFYARRIELKPSSLSLEKKVLKTEEVLTIKNVDETVEERARRAIEEMRKVVAQMNAERALREEVARTAQSAERAAREAVFEQKWVDWEKACKEERAAREVAFEQKWVEQEKACKEERAVREAAFEQKWVEREKAYKEERAAREVAFEQKWVEREKAYKEEKLAFEQKWVEREKAYKEERAAWVAACEQKWVEREQQHQEEIRALGQKIGNLRSRRLVLSEENNDELIGRLDEIESVSFAPVFRRRLEVSKQIKEDFAKRSQPTTPSFSSDNGSCDR